MANTIIHLSDSEEDEERNIPPREECESRCQAFAEVTGTDSALAMFYLQDRDWDLERSINAYFQQNDGQASVRDEYRPNSAKEKNPACRNQGTSQGTSRQLTIAPPVHQIQSPNQIKLLSWNIDGLDPDNLVSRTEGVCSVLLQENAEVVFLQEVVERSLAILRSRCSNYYLHIGAEGDGETPLSPNAYFTAMLLRKDSVTVDSVHIADFPTSMMSRNLLEVQATVKGVPMVLLTSHLESTASYAAERKRQLKMGFDRMLALPQDKTVIFGGDLNLRDKEMTGQSSKPGKVYDLWECTGKRSEARYTWDLQINDNKQIGVAKFQPRCRFDRLFVRHSQPVAVKPVYFELVGIQRLASCRRFPSDHWGILAHFNMMAASHGDS